MTIADIIKDFLGVSRPVVSFEHELNGDIKFTLGANDIMKNKQQIMADMKIMGDEYISNIKNQIKSEDADFLRTLLNIPEHPFTDLTTEMFQTYLKKNADYGDSFSKSLNENGLVAAKVRLEDKFNRFGNLIKNDQQVSDESKEDTLLDMANYAIMTVMWMRDEKPEDTTIADYAGIVKSMNDGGSPIVQWYDKSLECASKGVGSALLSGLTAHVPLYNEAVATTVDDSVRPDITVGEVVLVVTGEFSGLRAEVVAILDKPSRYILVNPQDEYDTLVFKRNQLRRASAISNKPSSGVVAGADLDGDIAIDPEWYVRVKKELEEFEKTRRRKITEGSVVKIREGRRAGMYDEVTRVLESPRRYNLKQEKSTIYYFPEELELIK